MQITKKFFFISINIGQMSPKIVALNARARVARHTHFIDVINTSVIDIASMHNTKMSLTSRENRQHFLEQKLQNDKNV